jgi:hypothetical protein
MASGFESRWGRHHPMMDTPPLSLPPAASAATADRRLCRSAPYYRTGCTVAAVSGGLRPPSPIEAGGSLTPLRVWGLLWGI